MHRLKVGWYSKMYPLLTCPPLSSPCDLMSSLSLASQTFHPEARGEEWSGVDSARLSLTLCFLYWLGGMCMWGGGGLIFWFSQWISPVLSQSVGGEVQSDIWPWLRTSTGELKDSGLGQVMWVGKDHQWNNFQTANTVGACMHGRGEWELSWVEQWCCGAFLRRGSVDQGLAGHVGGYNGTTSKQIDYCMEVCVTSHDVKCCSAVY